MPFLSHGLFIGTLVPLLGPLPVLGASSEVDLIIKNNIFSWLLPMLFNQSNICYKDLSRVAWGLFHLEQWALTMLDAVGKPEANLLGGNIGWLGSYEQCIGIKRRLIEGQHCWIKMKLESAPVKNEILSHGIRLIGICLPNSCKNKDLQPFAPSIDCEYDVIELTMTSYIAIGICCVLLLFIVVGTLLDVKRSRLIPSDSVENKQSDDRQLLKANSNNGTSIGSEVFSLFSNAKSLFSVEEQKRSTFPELNGLKTIAMALVICLHSYSNLSFVIKNPKEWMRENYQWYSQLLVRPYVISVFFLITGFLTLFSVLRKPPRANKGRFLFSYVINRYIKLLVAPSLIVFIFRITLLPLSASGPFWEIPETQCGSQWWKNALFISNWWPLGEVCFGSWWFLSATVQLHLLSLVVIVPLIYQRYRMCVLNGSGLLVGSWYWLAWMDILPQLPPQGDELSEIYTTFTKEYNCFTNHIYQTPILHIGAYVVGMGLAWVLFTHKDGSSLNKNQVFCGWIVFITFLFLTLYGLHWRPNRMLRRIHNMFGPTMYSLFIAWLILICHTTQSNSMVKAVLHWKYWLPLSKLSLGAYLLNETVMHYFYYSVVDKLVFTWPLQWLFFFRNWIMTHLMAAIATLTLEMPINAILDHFLTLIN